MIIYYAGADKNPKDVLDAVNAGARHFMISYFYWRSHTSVVALLRSLGCHIMLDSGAFSAWKKDESIVLPDYIAYIQRNQIGKYVVLDVIGDPDATDANLAQMENAGLCPIPVFHIGTEWARLDRYAGKYRLIALGGTVGKPTEVRDAFFRDVFERYPAHFFHGLGLTTPTLIRKYPWFSVDSTTWLIGKKNCREQTDAGQIPLDNTLSVSERVAVNVRYFNRLETEIKRQRYGGAA